MVNQSQDNISVFGKRFSSQCVSCTEKSRSKPDAAKPWIIYQVVVEIVDAKFEKSGVRFSGSSFQKFTPETIYPIDFVETGKAAYPLQFKRPKSSKEKASDQAEKKAEKQKGYQARDPDTKVDKQYGIEILVIPQAYSDGIQRLADISGYTPDQIQVLILSDVVPIEAPPAMIAVFLEACKARDLNPFLKEIHLIRFGSKFAMVMGIDGMRKKADQTGDYLENHEPLFNGMKIEEYLAKWDFPTWTVTGTRETPVIKIDEGSICPKVCKVSIVAVKGGKERTFFGFATWGGYYPGDIKKGGQYRKMPFAMLAKCAEAVALRKAFPAALGGVYEFSEMDRVVAMEEQGPKGSSPDKSILNQIENCKTKEEVVSMRDQNENLMSEEWFVSALNAQIDNLISEGETA